MTRLSCLLSILLIAILIQRSLENETCYHSHASLTMNDVQLRNDSGCIFLNNSIAHEEDFSSNTGISCTCTDTSYIKEWYEPNGVTRLFSNKSGVFAMVVGNSIILLKATGSITQQQQGVYACKIRDNNNIIQVLHIGIYKTDYTENLDVHDEIQMLQTVHDENGFPILGLNCTSSGRPATNVAWHHNDTSVNPNFSTMYRTEQILRNGSSSTYDNILKINGSQIHNINGQYQCNVTTASSLLEVQSDIGFIYINIFPPTPEMLSYDNDTNTLTWRPLNVIINLYEINLKGGHCNITVSFNKSVDRNEEVQLSNIIQNGTSYIVCVRALNNFISGNWSRPIKIVTPSSSPTGIPEKVSATPLTSNSIFVSWNAVDCSKRNSQISQYLIKYRNNISQIYRSNQVNQMNATISDLAPSSSYVVQVAAVNDNNEIGPYSDPVEVITETIFINPEQNLIIGCSVGGVCVLFLVIIITALIMMRMRILRRKRKTISASGSTVRFHELDEIDCEAIEPVIKDFPDDMIASEGEYVIFYVSVLGSPTPTLTWFLNDQNVHQYPTIEVSEDGTLSIPSIEEEHIGTYRLMASNCHGNSTKELRLTIEVDDTESCGLCRVGSIASMIDNAPIPVSSYEQYVGSHHAKNNDSFHFQFVCLNSDAKQATIGNLPENRTFNRFKNIVPYDDNKISLNPIPGCDDCQRVYINASYINGYNQPNKFIATQGPLPLTAIDFWRMVWQEKTSVIIMLCNIVENHRVKSQQYWPVSGSKTFGPISVHLKKEERFADYVVRTFEVLLTVVSETNLTVKHYHFLSWSDHAGSLLSFHKKSLSEYTTANTPVLVHCSAGVGRTGVFISLDRVLQQATNEGVVDIMGIVNDMRQQRMKMVQTLDQYIFIYDAVLESLVCGETQFAIFNFRVALIKLNRVDKESGKNGLENQFQVLQKITPKPEDVERKTALKCADLNRSKEFLPRDNRRVLINGENCDYIHATFVDGYKHKKAFIITQGPLEVTCNDFWRMVHQYGCASIVMLSELVEYNQEVCYHYWPKYGMVNYGGHSVELLKELKSDNFITRNFSLAENESGNNLQVTQFQILNWTPSGQCANYQTILTLIHEVLTVQMKTGNKPIVVHCRLLNAYSDTAGRSAIFCAVMTAMEHCKAEGVVDVFQIVKTIRMQKPGAILTVEQYSLIFSIVLAYLDNIQDSGYANYN